MRNDQNVELRHAGRLAGLDDAIGVPVVVTRDARGKKGELRD
jgi:hypothetical protein